MRWPTALRLPPHWAPYVFVAPFFLLFAVFGLFPLLFSLVLAFNSWEPTSGLAAMRYVGWENFAFALEDEWFWKALRNTLWLAVASGAPQHLVAIPLAVFIHGAAPRLRDALSGAYFLPYITSTVAIAIMFSALFSKDFGLVNAALGALGGIGPVDWLGQPETLRPAIAFIVFWRFVGFNTVLYLAALQTIPKDLYEAATMDGASRWRQFVHITLPGLKPMIYFGVTLSVIGGLQLFEEAFILTGGRGGTDQAGMTAAVYLYRMAFDFNDFGGASAMSWILCAVVVVLTWLTNRAFAERRRLAA
jgi:multiple sugar transport system permease protein